MPSAKSGKAGSLVPPTAPTVAQDADNADPGDKAKFDAQQTKGSGSSSSTPVKTHKPTGQTGDDKDKKFWIDIQLVDKKDKPVPGEVYRVTLPDGVTIAEGTLDEKGSAHIDGIDSGSCKITFPNLEKQAWKPR